MSNLKNRFPRYAKLLRLYPSEYRKHYEYELLQTTADMLDHADGSLERTKIWAQLAFDLPVNIAQQQLHYVGGVMSETMPYYIKRNGLISAALLLPFFAALIANAISTAIVHQDLYHSWLWSPAVGAAWVLLFPFAALLVAGVSYLVYITQGTQEHAVIKRIFDIAHSWPLLLTGIVACGILLMLLFHDSVQCWGFNPITHFQESLQCTAANSVNPIEMIKRAFGL